MAKLLISVVLLSLLTGCGSSRTYSTSCNNGHSSTGLSSAWFNDNNLVEHRKGVKSLVMSIPVGVTCFIKTEYSHN